MCKRSSGTSWLCGIAAVLAAVCSPSVTVAAGLTASEQRVVEAAAAETPRSIELLEKLVNINSGTLNLEGVKSVAEVMRGQLEPLGFKVRWVSMQEIGRAGHLIAEHPGSGRGKRMLLIGHMDTVFEKSSPFQAFVRRGDKAEGPGVNDMKDGLAIMVSALRAMKNARTLAPAHITIVLSGDEEWVGRPVAIARRDMLAAADLSDVALEFEALAQQDGRDMGTIARRGYTGWTLNVTAESGHSSGIFSDAAGFGAGYELARILEAFRNEAREPNATFNVGMFAGGATAQLAKDGDTISTSGKGNIIPAAAVAIGDLRTLSTEQTARIEDRLRAIVANSLGRTKAQISFDDEYPAMAPTPGNRALLAKLNGVNRDAGLQEMGELDPLRRGAGDIAFVAGTVDALVGFGAAGEGSHAPGETVDLTSFDRQIKRAALLMGRLSK